MGGHGGPKETEPACPAEEGFVVIASFRSRRADWTCEREWSTHVRVASAE